MADVAATVAALVEGRADLSSVALGESVEVGEALAEGGHAALLEALVEKVFPRFVKKKRFESIESLWIACCTAGAIPIPLLLRTAERVAARGAGELASDLVMMLSDTLIEADRVDEAISVLEQGLTWAPSESMMEAAATALSVAFPGVETLEETLARFRRSGDDAPGVALRRAERALRFSPGLFLQWSDGFIGQVASNNGVTAVIRHPSGTTEERAVDEVPPPRVLRPDTHEVLRLYDLDALKSRWRTAATESLAVLLEEQGGWVRVAGLQNILVPQVMGEAEFEATLAVLKSECGVGREDRPSYDPRRRMFVGVGVTPPKPKKRAAPARAVKRSGEPPASATSASAIPPAPTTGQGSANEQARWVDLTALPEIRELISSVESDVEALNKELNTELPLRLEEARAHGDLKENAEYDAAKERLRFVQARIGQLQAWLGQLHELSRVRLVSGRVTAMSVVTVADEATGEVRRLRLVPAELRRPQPGDVSVGTPYGRALLGKSEGDTVLVHLPRRTERLEIVKVVDPDEV